MTSFLTSLRLFLTLTVLCGVAYPLFVTAVARSFFTNLAQGSVLKRVDGTLIGSRLLGQKFESPVHFQGRPSAVGYQVLPSGASNLSLTSRELLTEVETRRRAGNREEMLYASGSGLDPHIRPESAHLQVDRIITALHLTPAEQGRFALAVHSLVDDHTEERQWKFLGERRVNVLVLNLALDEWMLSQREKRERK